MFQAGEDTADQWRMGHTVGEDNKLGVVVTDWERKQQIGGGGGNKPEAVAFKYGL